MKRMKFDDDELLILEALKIYQKAMCDKADADAKAKKHTFSEFFEARMKKMIRREASAYYTFFGSAAKKFAVALVCALILSFSAAMSIEASRNAIINFFTEVYEKFSVVFWEPAKGDESIPDDGSSIKELYKPRKVPEGYSLSYRRTVKKLIEYCYVDQQNNKIVFMQTSSSDGRSLILDTEDAEIQTKICNGREINYVDSKDLVKMFWYQDGYVFYLKGNDVDILLGMTELISEIE